jgi:hypothetical protein
VAGVGCDDLFLTMFFLTGPGIFAMRQWRSHGIDTNGEIGTGKSNRFSRGMMNLHPEKPEIKT